MAKDARIALLLMGELVVAILKGKPELTAEDITLLA